MSTDSSESSEAAQPESERVGEPPPTVEEFIPVAQREEIVSRLKERGVSGTPGKGVCPMCGGGSFSLVDGYFVHTLSKVPNQVQLGGRVLPTVGAVCGSCGYLVQYALGSLGLLETDGDGKSKS